ncbi:hypothetical protein ABK040_001712 [Willaertia magna]
MKRSNNESLFAVVSKQQPHDNQTNSEKFEERNIPIASKSIEQYVYSILDYGSYYEEDAYPEYSDDGEEEMDKLAYSPYQIIGPPTTYPRYEDSGTTYCPNDSNGTDYLIVQFEKPVLIKQVNIYETYGAVCKISALNSLNNNGTIVGFIDNNNCKKLKMEDTGLIDYKDRLCGGTYNKPLATRMKEENKRILNKMEWITLWEGSSTSGQHTTARIFSPPIIEKIFTNIIRIDMNFNEWYEIDCVKLDGHSFSSKEDFLYEILSMNMSEVNSYLEIFKRGQFCDLTLLHKESGFEINAHCMVLASRSLIFKEKIDNLYKNKKNNEEIKILVEDIISFETFKDIIGYMYSNYIEIDENNVISIYKFADDYEMNDLMDLCCNALYFLLTKNNILNLYNQTKEYNLQKLNDKIIKFIKDNHEVISDTKEIEELILKNETQNVVSTQNI